MARDKVHPLKMESPVSGGTELDEFPTGMNANEDYADVRGVVLQNGASSDEAVGIERVNSELMLWDSSAGTQSLSDLLATGSGISEATHKALRDLIHFIDGGPADGFVSGAFKETLPAGDPFHTSEIWWESASKVEKIVELIVTRNANQTPATEVWQMYATDGTTVLVTVTDTMAYSGVFETTRTRTWA